MGMVAGWIAVKGMGRDRILDAVGLVEAPGAPKPKASIHDLPNGWSVLVTTDFGFPTPERMSLLSVGGAAIAASLDEHTMFSVVRGYERGQAVFAIEHDGGSQGATHIAVAGKVPAEWAAILDKANRKQDEEDHEEPEVDLVFDAPLALADALCGYSYGGPSAEDEEPEITLLVQRKGPGLISRLFGNRA